MNTRQYLAAGVGVLLIGLLAWGVMRSLERLAGIQPAPDQVVDGTRRRRPPACRASPPLCFTVRLTATRSLPCGAKWRLPRVRFRRRAKSSKPSSRVRPQPYASVIPEGTALRAFYATERGDAFVDLSPEVSTKHSGGSSTELLTVYAIVNAVAANLPTIQRVQILIDGREVDTLAGHVDLRRPLERDFSMVRDGP